MYLPRDVKCEIYSKITDVREVLRFIGLYKKFRNAYKETKNPIDAKSYLESKLALQCITKINDLNETQAEVIKRNYDLFPNLEYTTGNSLIFDVNEIDKYGGRPLKNVGIPLLKIGVESDIQYFISDIILWYNKFKNTFPKLESFLIKMQIFVTEHQMHPANLEIGPNHIIFQDLPVIDELLKNFEPSKVTLQWNRLVPLPDSLPNTTYNSVVDLGLESVNFRDLDALLTIFPNVKRLTIRAYNSSILRNPNYSVEELTLYTIYDDRDDLSFLNNFRNLKIINTIQPGKIPREVRERNIQIRNI